MSCSPLNYLVLSSLLFFGCGGDGPSASNELGRPAGGYVREAPGCEPFVIADFPLIPMPYDQIMETFVPPGMEIARFAMDYEVWPLARVESIRAEFQSDRFATVPNVEIAGLCRRSLDMSSLDTHEQTQEVLRVRLEAGNADRTRLADLFFVVGDRELTVHVPADIQGADWFLVYEPAWGEPRIALAQASGNGRTFQFNSIPDGPGRVALIQTPSVGVQRGFGTLHAPGGFGGGWPAYVTAWYGGIVGQGDAEVTLDTVLPVGSETQYARLHEEAPLEWDPARGHMVLETNDGDGGAMEVPCGTSTRLVVAGYGEVEAAQDAAPMTVGPGDSTVLSDDCTTGTWQFTLRAHVPNGRALDVVVSEVL